MPRLRVSSLIETIRRWRPRASRSPLASEPLAIIEGEEGIKERENHAVYQTGPSKGPGNIFKTFSQYLVKASVVMRCRDMPKRK